MTQASQSVQFACCFSFVPFITLGFLKMTAPWPREVSRMKPDPPSRAYRTRRIDRRQVWVIQLCRDQFDECASCMYLPRCHRQRVSITLMGKLYCLRRNCAI